jgi:dinuclear metal center YbgI/SA1388 family protein
MTTVRDLMQWMELLAPVRLSEDWDNTGLLLGDPRRTVQRVMTCLTLTAPSAEEAVAERADLVLCHHPLPFRPLKRITTSEPTGRLLWELANGGISIYSPHTSWDSAAQGINAQIAQLLELRNPQPLILEKSNQVSGDSSSGGSGAQDSATMGSGRFGDLPQELDLDTLGQLVAARIPNTRLRGVDSRRTIRRVGIACGSGASLLSAAVMHGCDVFLTGEATFHQCLEAQSAGLSMLLVGHFASEKFALDRLADLCQQQFPEIEAWGSRSERDPVRSLS